MYRDADGLVVVNVYPRLLGTYGDRGNAEVLQRRTTERGIPATVLDADPSEPLPTYGDIYILGGGEDGNLQAATAAMAAERALHAAVDRGASVLAVCAGFQLLGETGLGLLANRTSMMGKRAVGHLVVQADARLQLADPLLVGFENHGGRTVLADPGEALGTVISGTGNGDDLALEGQLHGRIVATYLHGPVLALNPALADHLLGWSVGTLAPLPPGFDLLAERARATRLELLQRQ
ncbi:MAG: hypothetical protein QOF57_1195 [Frankiaceae bacterium]|nr:hypothetical protein [Frankiaceae bacterium]